MTIQNQMQNTAEVQKAEFLNKVWSDDAYRAQLQDDPKAALAEFGTQIPNDVEIKFVMDTDKVKYLHIPYVATEGEISDSDLLNAVGGTTPLCYVAAVSIAGAVSAGISAGITAATK
ncbi:nitrile hydratase subunit alpha [Ruegeria sp. 2205SS24-7]|uniref:nitrile hydratase subunit alpha n=1 Tax=Ruegeria discodermiae TaxID=3064389 RepID=UPI0027426189|nr:nitrile hydratase subunit alpha [Ruegeria sp. 2205SS24-7]MDP5219152.1 nitrile hydratase subunit alpha [Ruegeria sp. 2205SS24-7]